MKTNLRTWPKLIPIFTIVAFANCIWSGCKKGDKQVILSEPPTPLLIGVSQCNLGEPWRVQMNADIQSAAAKYPQIKLIFKDAQNDTLQQCAQVDELVATKVSAIIISPKEAQPLTAPVARAMDSGVPVIILDRSILGDKYTCFIGADNEKIGEQAGKWAVETLGGKGNIVELMGLQTSTPGQERHSGFQKGIAGSNVKIVFSADMKWLEPKAREEMESALSRYESIDLVFAHNDDGAHGAYLAAKAAGREKQMRFVGIDALPQEGGAYVKQGILDATFEYPTGGAEAIDVGMRILKGETVPKKISLPTRIFAKNVVQSK